MYNYHTDLVWQLNSAMLAASLILSAFIFVYAASKGFFANRRDRHLARIKEVGDEFRTCPVTEGKLAETEKIALSPGNKWSRIEAIIILGQSQCPSSLEVLGKTIREKDEDISYFSLLSLGHIKSLPAAKVLLDFLEGHIHSGHKIVSLLEVFPSDITAEVIKCTHSTGPFVRFWAVKLLSRFRPAECLNRIIELTQDESSDVRAASCECLGEIGSVEAKDALTACLSHNVWFVRMHAVRALSKILKQECIPLVSPLLEDGHWLVRESVKNAMNNTHAAR